MSSREGEKTVASNRRARFDYDVLETVEAGIALSGTEVKSFRASQVQLKDSYARASDGELWLIGSDIPEYAMGNRLNHKPKRPRNRRHGRSR